MKPFSPTPSNHVSKPRPPPFQHAFLPLHAAPAPPLHAIHTGAAPSAFKHHAVSHWSATLPHPSPSPLKLAGAALSSSQEVLGSRAAPYSDRTWRAGGGEGVCRGCGGWVRVKVRRAAPHSDRTWG